MMIVIKNCIIDFLGEDIIGSQSVLLNTDFIIHVQPWCKDAQYSVITMSDANNIACAGDEPIMENTTFFIEMTVEAFSLRLGCTQCDVAFISGTA